MVAALPHAPLTIIEDITDDLAGPLADGDLDAAIVASDVDHPRFETIALFCEPLSVLMPAGHALAKRRSIQADDIDPGTLLLLNEGHCLRDRRCSFAAIRASAGARWPTPRATSLETLFHLTAAGYGMTIVPALALAVWQGMTDRIVARPLVGAQRHVRLIVRRTRTPCRT